VVEVALALRELCESIGLPSFVKTSGQKGLHVLLPLGGACTHDESRALGELVARAVERRLPRIATTERIIEARKGRVYLDYLQNGEGKTIVAAYSVRPVPGATVSTPLRWSEVGPALDPRAFTLRTVPRRAQELGDDPALAVLSIEPDLPAILGRLANELRR
jgi:bifunctional non-homologous end joining protein LigD